VEPKGSLYFLLSMKNPYEGGGRVSFLPRRRKEKREARRECGSGQADKRFLSHSQRNPPQARRGKKRVPRSSTDREGLPHLRFMGRSGRATKVGKVTYSYSRSPGLSARKEISAIKSVSGESGFLSSAKGTVGDLWRKEREGRRKDETARGIGKLATLLLGNVAGSKGRRLNHTWKSVYEPLREGKIDLIQRDESRGSRYCLKCKRRRVRYSVYSDSVLQRRKVGVPLLAEN